MQPIAGKVAKSITGAVPSRCTCSSVIARSAPHRPLMAPLTCGSFSSPFSRLIFLSGSPAAPSANFINGDSHRPSEVSRTGQTHLYQQDVKLNFDVSMRPITPFESNLFSEDRPRERASIDALGPRDASLFPSFSSRRAILCFTPFNGILLLGERLMERSCRWSAKFYGQVTFGPRGFAYPSSRWLARRFRMKKHRIIKRFRFRRYKLAAVANLPFAKMIRVGMLPELKSSKTRKGDMVDASLSAHLVSQAKTSTGGKVKGRRSRPKSKYQV